jgi:hydroxyacylglutathione hydrolase
MITVDILPILDDNYAYLISAPCGTTAIIDPGHGDQIIAYLDNKNVKPDYIINTHHHWDHVNGNPKVKAKYNIKIAAPIRSENLIKGGVDIPLTDGDIFKLGDEEAVIIETPGHTMDGICLYFKESGIVFTGDTLFSMGCGRLFEGSAEDMFTSFQKIATLPDDTMIYCGHEYTRANAGFCLAVDRHNDALKKRIEEVKSLRSNGLPTLPVSLKTEKETNVFMKAKSAEEFAALRRKKDSF